MKSILIKGGRVVSPADGIDRKADVLIENGRIAEIGRPRSNRARLIDATGRIVAPGLIDIHVHLREPGHGTAETIKTGLAAAVAGGFTAVAAMPNTEPPVDNESAVVFQTTRAARARSARLWPIGAVSRGLEGKELAELALMARAGAVAFSDDGRYVADSALMKNALSYASMLGKVVIDHCEDPYLSEGTQMHAADVSARLGLSGSPAQAEQIAVERDLALAELTGARLHIAHVSTAKALESVRRAKRKGVRVSCEVTPHHLLLTDEELSGFDTNFKVRPPLRTKADVRALAAGLRSGAVDCIASDHAPHPFEEKEQEFLAAPFGMTGLETTLALISTEFVRTGVIDWPRAIELLSAGPARVLGISGGTLAEGAPADVTIIDPDAEWTIDAQQMKSLARNTPFHGRRVTGRAAMTIIDGEVR